MSVPNTFASATSAIPLANLDADFAYYDAAFQIVGGAMNVNYTFRLEDTTDNTKIGEFVLSGITTGTTRQYTMPNASGTLATLGNVAQTFIGNVSVGGVLSCTNAVVNIGTATVTATYGFASGATAAAVTKTINIGTAGVSTSITNINYGSSVTGALVTHIWNAGANSMRFTSAGDLGIGTTSPDAILHTVETSAGAATVGAFLQNSNATVGTETRLAFAANANLLSDNRYGWIGYVNTGGTNGGALTFATTPGGQAATERMRLDSAGNLIVSTGAVVVYAPAPAAISTTATLTNANIQAQIINTTGTTYTVTMPLGTTLETLVAWSAVNLGYDFTVINTASGTITMAANTGVTTLGALTIATGVSAEFRIRRTAANTFIMYRLG